MSDHCVHGFAKGRRCPQCGGSGRDVAFVRASSDFAPRAARPPQTGSVYEGRAAPSDSGRWIRLGELDEHGRGFVDYSRADGFVPIEEFLWRRR
jgi:hypothetical protein